MSKHKKNKQEREEDNASLLRQLRAIKKTIKKQKAINITPPAKKSRKRRRRVSTSSSSSSTSDQSSTFSTTSSAEDESETPVKQVSGTEAQADQENKDPNVSHEELDPEVLELIGKRLAEEKKFDSPVHQDIADRWQDVLKQGLPTDMRVDLIKKYPVPMNCAFADPPKLNPELLKFVTESNKKRDDRILAKQAKIAAALAALAKVASAQLKDKSSKDKSLLGHVNDAAKLILDVQRDETIIRRSLVIATINPAAKDLLTGTTADDWLFGSGLPEKLKTASALEGQLKILKPASKPGTSKASSSASKNGKAPLKRPLFRKSSQGGKTYRSSGSKAGQTSPSRKRSPHRRSSSRRH